MRLLGCEGFAAGHCPNLAQSTSTKSNVWPPETSRTALARGMGGRIAQLVEQLTLNQRVQGSSPCAPTNLIKRLEMIDPAPSGAG